MNFRFLDTISYAVLHGWQGLPEYLPSDLDIALPAGELQKLERELLAAEDARLVQMLQHESTCLYFVLAAHDDKGGVRYLPLDGAVDYRRDGRIWFSAEELLEGRWRRNSFWVAAPGAEFQYLLVKKILKRQVPPHAAARLRELAEELGPAAEGMATRLLGSAWGPRVLDWIRSGDREALEGHAKMLTKVLRRERLRRDPLNPLRYWIPELGRVWRRWRHPTGLHVAVLGPDGAGKSTLLRGLERELAGAFRHTRVFHLMPRLFRNGGGRGPVTDPHAEPPRSLGGSLLKLVYYVLDYGLGYWTRVRPALVRSTLVLFDRYYDDLFVDPRRYRYGGPPWLARWLRRVIPRPDVFLVLDVPVERLLERKQELPREELTRQVAAYRRFAIETPNALLLDGGQPREAVVRQARDALLDFLHERYLARRKVWFPERGDDLEWLSRALGVAVGGGKPTHAYLRLPDGRGFLLPLGSGATFRRGLALYPAQGRKGRLVRGLLRAAAGVGLEGPGLRRVRLVEGEDSVLRELETFFGRDDLRFAVSLGTPGPHRKPVVQVMTSRGEVLGYAKVGWNEPTRTLVEREAAVLRTLDRTRLPFAVPEILHATDDGTRSLCLQAPPPRGVIPAPPRLGRAQLAALEAMPALGIRWEPLEETTFWLRIETRAREVRNAYWAQALRKAMNSVKSRWNGRKVPLHLAHGDFAPWNMLVSGDTLYLYDWEYAQEWAPAGYDLFHFLLQTFCLVEGKKIGEAIGVMMASSWSRARAYWERAGVGGGAAEALFYLFVLDLVLSKRFEEQVKADRLGLLDMMSTRAAVGAAEDAGSA